jgi:hypothetical protein
METLERPYMLIYKVSHLSLLSFFYALYMQQNALAIVPGSVFISSTLYWYKPDYSWRRYLDMAVVKSCFVYQGIIAYTADFAAEYYAALVAISFYPIGILYHKKGDTQSSIYAHVMLHIFANLANIVLYSSSPLTFTPPLPQLPAHS